MQPRMNNPAMTVPGAMEALQKLGAAARRAGVPATTLYLVEVRASQINGCSVCLDMHSRELKAAGEPDERIFMVGAWREAPYFSDAERAALALTEAATRLADRSDPIPDEVWEEAARHYDERELAGAGDRDRGDQRLEPHQRCHAADHRRVGRRVGQPDRAGRPRRLTIGARPEAPNSSPSHPGSERSSESAPRRSGRCGAKWSVWNERATWNGRPPRASSSAKL